MKSGIYKIEAPSGGFYIGSSNNLVKRKREHYSAFKRQDHPNRVLQRAWNKYSNDLEFRILLVCEETDLLFYEQLVIDGLKPDYNLSPTAGNCLGTKHGTIARENMSKAHIGIKHTVETRLKMSKTRTGSKQTPEWIAHRVASRLRNKLLKLKAL